MKLKLQIPDSLNDITLEQYIEFDKINIEENKDTTFLMQKTVEIFCKVNLDLTLQIKYTDLADITNHIYKILDEVPELVSVFKMESIEYGFIPKLDDITLGEYIDLDSYLGNWSSMHKAMSVLYRPVTYRKGNRYLIEDYDGSKFADKMLKMPLGITIGAMVFLEFKKRTTESFPELFEGGDGRESNFGAIESFGAKWGWYQSVFALSNGNIAFENITKLNAMKCLTMLSFMKEKSELEANQLKKLNKIK